MPTAFGLRVHRLKRFAYSLGLLLAAPALAHPLHTSLAEADYHRTTRKLEVALRVFADDFEAALSVRAKTKISFEKTPRSEFDALTRSYLAERFTVKSPDGLSAPLAYLGRDFKGAANELWLFFEFELHAGVDGATLHHAVLAEQFSDQINTVQLRDAGRHTTLVFLPSHAEKRIRFRP